MSSYIKEGKCSAERRGRGQEVWDNSGTLNVPNDDESRCRKMRETPMDTRDWAICFNKIAG